MSEPIIQHSHICSFASNKVNLGTDDVNEYRAQVNRLRDKLATYVNAHPDYGLVKMLHSGSVAKGTALKTINDMDVAVYVKASEAPQDESKLLSWLLARLQEAYPNLSSDQFSTNNSHCVTLSFRGTGLDVDVVPVLYEGEPDDIGYLIAKDTGERVLTSITLHLNFIIKRKAAQPQHFRQVIRLVKWWIRQQKVNDESFRFKSFMAELLCAHLADSGIDMSNYPLALEEFFTYIVSSGLKKRIAFNDNYASSELPKISGAVIEIFDPVNPANNVASRYSEVDRLRIIEAAHTALDALNEAHYATTKGRAVEKWQVVLGPSFTG